ncbi:family 16 glycosylhydrolase [Thalassobellus suaedae]|uniref:Glycoside hydrolase family 16 protein n=1 Tax=Thalassobellus suaedae TaxID=3074124 RepID=A0ABY9Y7G1_9FLAO|nr:glycoside hydrolase family 16 protein [Flavobacteriaceae bacterium HL-DH10]
MNQINKFNMKGYHLNLKTVLVLSILCFFIFSCSTDETQTVAKFKVLVMADEFDAEGAPNTEIWGYDTGTGVNGWGNNELQYYTKRTENVKVENGVLLLTALKEDFNGASYTSARLSTKDLFEQAYGRFEARIKVTGGSGLWPAFWLLGADCETEVDDNPETLKWPICGEIDIMEYRRQEPTKVSGSVHGPGYSGETNPQGQITKSYDLGNDRLDAGFHIYGIEWGPEYINYYIDDVLYNQITPSDIEVTPSDVIYELEDGTDVTGNWVFNKPFYIIINLAVGGAFPGAPDSDETFPQSMLVDYVRVYKSSNN